MTSSLNSGPCSRLFDFMQNSALFYCLNKVFLKDMVQNTQVSDQKGVLSQKRGSLVRGRALGANTGWSVYHSTLIPRANFQFGKRGLVEKIFYFLWNFQTFHILSYESSLTIHVPRSTITCDLEKYFGTLKHTSLLKQYY